MKASDKVRTPRGDGRIYKVEGNIYMVMLDIGIVIRCPRRQLKPLLRVVE